MILQIYIYIQYFQGRPQILIGALVVLLETPPDVYWRPTVFHWRPPEFHLGVYSEKMWISNENIVSQGSNRSPWEIEWFL